jgi:hypothetical protein
VRLRPLTEAECYARCYGDLRTDQVVVLRPGKAEPSSVERLGPDDEEPAGIREEAA